MRESYDNKHKHHIYKKETESVFYQYFSFFSSTKV